VPRHIRNILIAALLTVLALAAGINGYIHHQFKTNIDSALNSIRSYAQVKYSELSTSLLTGKIELKNVRVSSDFLPEELTLGNITLETPGFSYMLNGPENIKNGEFPKHLELKIDELYFDLHGKTADWLDRLVNRMQPIYATERKLCRGKSIFGPSDYKEMGYSRLSSDMRIAYNFNETNKTLNINLSSKTRNMGSLDAFVTVSNIGSLSSEKIMQQGMPQLSNAEITYKDETYVPHIVKFCSELSNMTTEKFIDAEIKQTDKYFYMVWGFAPGQGLREAYKDFLLKPDVVTLTMSPDKEFNPMMLSTQSNEEIMQALNVSLKINGLNIKELSFKMPPAKFTEQFHQLSAKALDFDALLKGEPIKPPDLAVKPKVYKKAPAKYHRISLKKAPQHINNFVRITTKNGNKRKGQLLRIDNINLYVQKKVSGGKFTMTVPRVKIKTIESYFSIRVLTSE
jgi:hypothetical protein